MKIGVTPLFWVFSAESFRFSPQQSRPHPYSSGVLVHSPTPQARASPPSSRSEVRFFDFQNGTKARSSATQIEALASRARPEAIPLPGGLQKRTF